MLTTERLNLRLLTDDDLDNLLALYNDPEVNYGYSGSIAPKGPKLKDTLKRIAEESSFHALITLKGTDELVGECAISKIGKNRNGKFTIGLHKKFWGKGYGKEASKFVIDYGFRWLNLHRMTVEVFGNNHKAIALYQSLGFTLEGRMRDVHWIDGGWVDDLNMGILDTEHAALQKKVEQT